MKFKYLIASAALVIGVAAYTLTLSFTETDLMSQLEALANNESGESGGWTGGEDPENGGNKYRMNKERHFCQSFEWVQRGEEWELVPIGGEVKWVTTITCQINTLGDLTTCHEYDPCNPTRPGK